jgi:mycofactocin precursor
LKAIVPRKEVFDMDKEKNQREEEVKEKPVEGTSILEEITIEELAVDGICGVY